MEEDIAFGPMQVEYDETTPMVHIMQDVHIKITAQIIAAALARATDQQLRQELQRRANARKALKYQELRCRNCIYCIQGYANTASKRRGYETSVCKLKPKPQAGEGCYYATLQSRKACDQFLLKQQDNE